MIFIDKANVLVRAGAGGDGRVSFRQEKFIDRGGPDGGDGGDGGDVIFVASRNQNSLVSFRYQRELAAEAGKPGDKTRKHGRSAKHLIVAVPVGTIISDNAGEVLADLANDEQRAIIAKGGRGGFGNAHFISSRRQAPKFAEKGEQTETMDLTLELKMIADVGLVGLPNAGKSTLLSVVSNARPEIADYPFTTLTPNLGVVDVADSTSLLVADIPGLIEGAAQGKGLGDEFLRHVERTAVLVHLVDAYQDDIALAYETIQAELKAYQIDLSIKPQVLVLSKIDGLSEADMKQKLKLLAKLAPKGTPLYAISSQAGTGLRELKFAIAKLVTAEHQKQAEVAAEAANGLPVISLGENALTWRVSKSSNGFIITGSKVERFAGRTDFENETGIQRLRDIMRKMGIMHELRRQNVVEGDHITIGGKGSFRY